MSSLRPITPVSGSDLAAVLREATPAILSRLGRTLATPARWRFETRDETDIEWNGALAGPSTYAVWRLIVRGKAEAEVRLDVIRWSPSDVHRTEVSGFWKVRDAAASLFARAERDAMITGVGTDDRVWAVVWGDGSIAESRGEARGTDRRPPGFSSGERRGTP